jgi:hypothetical protein
MQFGLTLQRVLQHIAYANPAFSPVLALKCDFSDGFYRVPLASSAIPFLGVIMPYSPGEAPLIAFPLALPMGWTNSPPFFSAFTETATDIANQRLSSQCPITRPHRLEHIAPDTPPICATHHSSSLQHPYNHERPSRPLAQIDVYVDDFIGLAQRPTASAVRRTLLHTIDQVFRPPTAPDTSAYCDPISLSKLAKGDLHWGTSARILGWDIDTATGTLRLPPHRRDRLHALLASFHGIRRTSRKHWHQLLGELRSMAHAIPGAKYMFSLLQHVLVDQPHASRVHLSSLVHATLQDWQMLADQMATHPTPITHLVPTAPTHIGTCDASKSGMGGVWFPTSLKPHASPPLIWSQPFPTSIQNALVSNSNPSGSITNSDLELLGVVAHTQALATTQDLSNATLWIGCDNTPAVAWSSRGSSSVAAPRSYLLRHLGLLTRAAQMKVRVLSVPGESNTIADFLSRSFHLSDDAVLHHLSTHFPTQPSLQWLHLGPADVSRMTSALLQKMLPPESLQVVPPAPPPRGQSGPPSAIPTTLIPISILRVPSMPSSSLPNSTTAAKYLPVELSTALARWKTQFMPWARRWPSWGKKIPV